MKRVFYCLLFFYGASQAYSQDLIVTTKGDSIQCEITRVTPDYIHFSVLDGSGNILLRSRLPMSTVESYTQSALATEDKPKLNAHEETSSPQIVLMEYEPPKLRAALDAGFTYQLGGYDGFPQSYKDQVQTLWYFGGQFQYFINSRVGVGLRYNYIFTPAEEDFLLLNGNTLRLRDELIRFQYTSASFHFRQFITDEQMVQYVVASGLIDYRSDYELDGESFTEDGRTVGFSLGVIYDILLSQSFGMGIGVEATMAQLTEVDLNGVSQGADFDISRIDLTVGFRLYK